MDYEEFKDKVEAMNLSQLQTCYKKIEGWGDIDSVVNYVYRSKKEYKEFLGIFAEWSTGGVTGGGYWNDSDSDLSSYQSDNPPEELNDLDKILEKFCPNITFLQYRNLINEIVKHGSRNEGDYYGNSTNYSYKYIVLEDLFDYMNDKGWL